MATNFDDFFLFFPIYFLFMADPVGAESNHKVWIKFKLKQN